MSIDENKARKLFQIKKNQLKMVSRRGYDIRGEEPLFNYTLDNFLNYYVTQAKKKKKTIRSLLTNFYKNEQGELIYVYFADAPSGKQLSKDSISEVIVNMKGKSKNAIIITPNPLSTDAKKSIANLLTDKIYVFTETEMSYDPTEHIYTPPHRALSEEEQRKLLSSNNISIDQMPILLTTDIISRYYGFTPGQVVEIKRINMFDTMVPDSLYYRAVKDDTSIL